MDMDRFTDIFRRLCAISEDDSDIYMSGEAQEELEEGAQKRGVSPRYLAVRMQQAAREMRAAAADMPKNPGDDFYRARLADMIENALGHADEAQRRQYMIAMIGNAREIMGLEEDQAYMARLTLLDEGDLKKELMDNTMSLTRQVYDAAHKNMTDAFVSRQAVQFPAAAAACAGMAAGDDEYMTADVMGFSAETARQIAQENRRDDSLLSVIGPMLMTMALCIVFGLLVMVTMSTGIAVATEAIFGSAVTLKFVAGLLVAGWEAVKGMVIAAVAVLGVGAGVQAVSQGLALKNSREAVSEARADSVTPNHRQSQRFSNSSTQLGQSSEDVFA